MERRAWYYEQLVQLPPATLPGTARHQLQLGATNFSDSLSFQAIGIVDASLVEIKAQYSERYFARATDLGRELSTSIDNDRLTGGLEIARYFIAGSRRYGRLGVEGLLLEPAKSIYLKIGLATGIVAGPDTPWSFSVNSAYLISLPRGNDFVSIQLQTMRRIIPEHSGALSIGGFLYWTYRLRKTNALGDNEMMLFSFGPAISWGGLRVAVAARLQLDKRVVPDGTIGNAENPSVLRLPDVSITWGLPL